MIEEAKKRREEIRSQRASKLKKISELHATVDRSKNSQS